MGPFTATRPPSGACQRSSQIADDAEWRPSDEQIISQALGRSSWQWSLHVSGGCGCVIKFQKKTRRAIIGALASGLGITGECTLRADTGACVSVAIMQVHAPSR